jgi:hypothetical protein
MTDILTSLTAVAVSAFRDKQKSSDQEYDLFADFWTPDPVVADGQRRSLLIPGRQPGLAELTEQIFAQPELANLGPREGELDPMLLHPRGGVRLPPASLVTGLLSSAFLQMYWLRLPENEGTFVRIVLEGFEELRRAAQGEQVHALELTGVAGVTLPEGRQFSTPWGIVRPSPKPRSNRLFTHMWQPKTTCTLAHPLLVPIRFDRAPEPKFGFEATDAMPDRSRILFALACALASREAVPVAPLLTWSTLVLPFQGVTGYSMSLVPVKPTPDVDLGDHLPELEEWARVVDRNHAPAVEVAANRLVSAIARRIDRTDALIDAVMVWENLVGSSSEVAFRVTAALTKMLEADPAKRREVRKSLASIYNIRSRVVHGDAVDQADVDDACTRAIDVAVRALRVSYRRGPDWLGLSSNERAESVLLEWP